MEPVLQAMTDAFFGKVAEYAALDEDARDAWRGLLVKRAYPKGALLVSQGQPTRNVFFVLHGLLLQYHVSEDGEAVAKRFFPEHVFAASTAALLTESDSDFSIKRWHLTCNT